MPGTTTIVVVETPDPSGLLRAVAERGHGRVSGTFDAGFVAVFPTSYDGARAAVALQQSADQAGRRPGGPPVDRAGLRIGIHVADLVEGEVDDHFGASVAVARTLCATAGPQQIVASDVVRMLVGPRPDLQFVPMDINADGAATGAIPANELLWAPLPDGVPVRVVVADDSALIRSGVVRLLAESGFDVISEAADYPSLIAAIDRDPPDLVVTDIRMPPDQRDEGLRAATYIKSHHPDTAVLILSQYVEATAAAGLLDGQTAGIGYLLKERVNELDEFVANARVVASGGSIIDPLVTEQLLAKRRAATTTDSLSDREKDVLALMAQGLSNQAICARLFLSPKTVETHVRSIFNKFGLPEAADGNRRVQAVVRWLQNS